MKNLVIFVLAAVAAPAVWAQESKPSPSPVADATPSWLQREGKNLIASATEIPSDAGADDVRDLMWHVARSNRMLCSAISGRLAPKDTGVTAERKSDRRTGPAPV